MSWGIFCQVLYTATHLLRRYTNSDYQIIVRGSSIPVQCKLDFSWGRIKVRFGLKFSSYWSSVGIEVQFGLQFSSDSSSVQFGLQSSSDFSSVQFGLQFSSVQISVQFSPDFSSVQSRFQFSSVRIVQKTGQNLGSVQFSSGGISSVYFTTQQLTVW